MRVRIGSVIYERGCDKESVLEGEKERNRDSLWKSKFEWEREWVRERESKTEK